MTTFDVRCSCGMREERIESLARAEVVAELHEARRLTRYRHETRIEEKIFQG